MVFIVHSISEFCSTLEYVVIYICSTLSNMIDLYKRVGSVRSRGLVQYYKAYYSRTLTVH